MWQLLGSAVAGLMIILAMPVYNDIQANNLNDTVDADAASQFQTILAGAQKYVVAQKDTLTDELSIGDAYQEVPFADLLNTQTLPGGFSQTNVLGATWHVYVQQPASGAIRTMVAATGGRTLKQSDLINIAGLTGDQGGYVPYDGMLGDLSSSEAHGTTWNLPLTGLPSPGAGHLFGTVTVGDAASPTIDTNDFLYRVGVPGHDELNTMGVALNMGANNINNVATLNAQQGIFSNNVSVTAVGCAFNAPGACLYGDGTNTALRTKGTVYFQHMDGSQADTNANHASMQAAITGTDNGTAIIGGACTPNGAFASNVDGSGSHLECVNGVWANLGGGEITTYAVGGIVQISNGAYLIPGSPLVVSNGAAQYLKDELESKNIPYYIGSMPSALSYESSSYTAFYTFVNKNTKSYSCPQGDKDVVSFVSPLISLSSGSYGATSSSAWFNRLGQSTLSGTNILDGTQSGAEFHVCYPS
ncbi:shufflon system plasmid conjugative transfer pilus tip adhesin PilV [Acetobacter okinawensis]|uniref:shufflon system plasmid conjugative transfer pilus tip adhesin PilV n=1 Tax=Acetobacter okinawensis TaxID=1076594 RepID=UPI00046EC2B8|nr:shufflon system plasmid conjugative transfer pilus tip adhesin PilV [Acetobacter okinawensis]